MKHWLLWYSYIRYIVTELMFSGCSIYKSNPQRVDAAVNIITIFGVQAQPWNVIELYIYTCQCLQGKSGAHECYD